jgi:hypothetical protein
MGRVLSGLSAVAMIGAARRFDGWPAIGLAALGGIMAVRALSSHRIGKPMKTISMDRVDPVQQAGEDSFPASDPPSWSPTSAGSSQSPTAQR